MLEYSSNKGDYMSTILPYDENLAHCNAFIKPNGTVFKVDDKHEKFADTFCNGKDYELYKSILDGSSYYSTHFDEFKKDYGFLGTISELDVYGSSNLTPMQLIMYKLYRKWLTKEEFISTGAVSDFLVCFLSFDKVETVLFNTITTSSTHPHIRFWNYYLMDWSINTVPSLKLNKEDQSFFYVSNDFYANDDQEAAEELDDIKRLVRVKDRSLFFK